MYLFITCITALNRWHRNVKAKLHSIEKVLEFSMSSFKKREKIFFWLARYTSMLLEGMSPSNVPPFASITHNGIRFFLQTTSVCCCLSSMRIYLFTCSSVLFVFQYVSDVLLQNFSSFLRCTVLNTFLCQFTSFQYYVFLFYRSFHKREWPISTIDHIL